MAPRYVWQRGGKTLVPSPPAGSTAGGRRDVLLFRDFLFHPCITWNLFDPGSIWCQDLIQFISQTNRGFQVGRRFLGGNDDLQGGA